ncbi:hypothetical protein J2T18_004214 [Paenibacillus polymyxa]|uniref:TnsD family Tn7-like transposition protein n=1 Tax=Paenibacillus polymyxa TaxID=1406 RepID=UPI00278E1AAE|nr:TnsD family Tn7-like transposition protein [Paenibacillus polymyxa]MDQ0049892.1 hypothetical protein [Paenibacillus polymyxa]
MIYFPSPLPDELLYSIFARYHTYSGNISTKKTMRDLFTQPTVCAVTDLPSHLHQLELRIPGQAISVDTILQKHTLLPYYRLYIPEERYQSVAQELLYGDGQSVHMKMGLPANGVKQPSFLRYCSLCALSDRNQHGAAYWHRSHQLPGVEVCPVHGCYLHFSSVTFSQRRNKHEFIALDSILGDDLLIHKMGTEKEALISERSTTLLNKEFPSMDWYTVRALYQQRLIQMGLLTAKGNIRIRQLLPEFISFYDIHFLKKWGCTLDEDSGYTWLHKMLRRPRHSHHPLRHILLQLYLNIEITPDNCGEASKRSILPFGEGPWLCLNKSASHYREPIIDKVVITRCSGTGKPVGTFTCYCGFVYSRRGPDIEPSDKYRIGRIKEFGETWRRSLMELNSDKTLSLREKARRLGVDPMTVKKQESILVSENEKREEATDNLNLLIHKTSAQPKHMKKSASPKRSRVNWNQRDQELAQNVLKIAREFKETNRKRRITKSEIGRQLNSLTLIQTKLHKLPLTRASLDEVAESSEEYNRRRKTIVS